MIFFPIISLIIVAGATRLITKTWLSPGSFFTICWSFFLIVPIVFAHDYPINPIAIWFIVIFSMSLSSGSIIAYSTNNYKNRLITNNFNNHHLLNNIVIIFSLISFIGLYLLFNYVSGIYKSNYFINDWMMIPNLIAIDRYAGLINYPFIIKYSLYLIYPANLLAGLAYGLTKKSKKMNTFLLLPLLAAILLGIIEGARTSIILGLILFFSSWLSSLIFQSNQTINKKNYYLRFAFGFGSLMILFIIFFILIQWLREGMDTLIVDLMIERIRAYFFGYLSAFSIWLSGNFESNYNYGLITFAGIFNLIGLMERPLGFYDSISIAGGTSTNIFTAFRGIITDFTIPGAIFLAFTFGYIFQKIFQNKNKITLLSVLPISMFYAFTLYSPLISIFHYNSILFSWLIVLIILKLTVYEPLDSNS
tara:strand:- start:1760 stop:3019 length:1260 start_codon:yes stop_codon:yes gene_type:complete